MTIYNIMQIICICAAVITVLYFLYGAFGIREIYAKKYREKYSLRKLHKMLINEKKSVGDAFYNCFFDIRNNYSYEALIIKSFDDVLLAMKKDEVMQGFRYALALAESGVFSEEKAKSVISYVFKTLCIGIDKAKKLPTCWYKQDNVCIGDFVLTEASDEIFELKFVFEKKSDNMRISVKAKDYSDIYDVITQVKEGTLTSESSFINDKIKEHNVSSTNIIKIKKRKRL